MSLAGVKRSNHIVKKVFRQTLVVQILTMLIGVLGMVVDGAVTGSLLSVDHMAAYGIVMPMLTIFSAVATICEVGTSTLLGRIIGSGKAKQASIALSSCLVSAVALSLIVGLVTCFGREFIVGLLGAQSGTFMFEEACNFLFAFSFIAPAMFIVMTLFPVMQLNSDAKRLISAIVLMTLVNIALDFANGLVIGWGLFGMALATTISYYAALAVLIPHFFRKHNLISFSLKGLSFSYTFEMVKYGLPNTLQQICRSLLVICINHFLLQISTSDAVAVYTAIMSAANMCMVLGSALGTTALIVGSVFDGEKDLASLKDLMRLCFVFAVVLDIILTVVLIIFAPQLMPCFLKGAQTETMQMLIRGFRLYALSITFYAVNCILRMHFLVIKKVSASYLFAVFNNFLFPFIAAFGLGSLIGLDGVWLSYVCGELLTMGLYGVYVLVLTDKESSLFERILLISPDYKAGIKAEYEASLTSPDDIVTTLPKIADFCKNEHASPQITKVIMLAVEEMASNVFQHAQKDAGAINVDIKIMKESTCWKLRMRDDCPSFNPVEYITAQELKEDETEQSSKSGIAEKQIDGLDHLGIRLVYKTASNMEYLNTLNLNNLIVTFS